MGLYERLGGLNGAAKVPIHAFCGVLQEFALGYMTAAQARDAFSPALDATAQTEAAALKDTITAITHADATVQAIARRLRAVEVERVLFLLEEGVAQYDTVAEVKARLGVA